MKKVFIALSAAAIVMSGSAFAQDAEREGGSGASGTATGALTAKTVSGAILGLAVGGALLSNVNGSATGGETPVEVPVVPVEPEPTCDSGDSLVDGVCIGTTVTNTVTLTVTGTGTMTSTATTTVTVPVTFTYAPSL